MKTFIARAILLMITLMLLPASADSASKKKDQGKSSHPMSFNPKKGPGSSSSASAPLPQVNYSYSVTVVTGDVEGAGTNARVYLTLNGEKGSSPETELKDTVVDTFERNAWNDFSVGGDYGAISSIRLRHDNSGKKAGWHVNLVRVRNNATGAEDIFFLDRWLAMDESDRKIDLTINRAAGNPKTLLLKPPFSEAYQWHKAPGVSSAWTRAYKANGWINFYADAFIGGAAAEAGQIARFQASAVTPVAIKARLLYVGGPINFGLASFSELQSRINFNGSVSSHDFKGAFSGGIIKDKIKKIIALADDEPDLSAPFNEFVDKMNEGKAYQKLASSLETMNKAKEASELILYKAGKTKIGTNMICPSIRTNASAVLTGSSVIIVGGIIESIEVIGVSQ